MPPTIEGIQNERYARHESPYEHIHAVDFGTSLQGGPGLAPSGAETDDKRKKGSSASATNDKELRELLVKNDGRSLKEVATEVIQKERTPQAEKTKQLFAMLWLKAVCKSAKTSVPRNRVYSHYADRCATERVVPLNPASFGKLVRVIFPGIQTRRLGVRGESKYHYVGLELGDEMAETNGLERRRSSQSAERQGTRHASLSTQIDFNTIPRLPADTAVFPTHDQSFQTRPAPLFQTGPPSQGGLFADPNEPGIDSNGDGPTMYEQCLKFPSTNESPFRENDPIVLPDIHRYVPPKTDIDVADALTALYRTHCTSLIDCIRFCKEKQFFRLFTSFHGTLTVPVQKLLAHPNIPSWIRECDWLMYQKMVRFVSQLTLQAAPPVVITILNNIANNLLGHIKKTFQSQPTHVLQAKLEPATIFASLLHRMIRVNAAAHAAANLLTNDQVRDQMWQEWVVMVNPKRVLEAELPNCGYEEVYKIMTRDIRGLLEPLSCHSWLQHEPFHQDSHTLNSYVGNGNMQISTETVLDRWSVFLTGLPSRFPRASTRTILHCISAIGTAALRDITISGGGSYQTWWVTKIFVDEMSLWLAAMGGFLEHQPSEPPNTNLPSPPLENGNGMSSREHSRFSSLGADFSNDVSFAHMGSTVQANAAPDAKLHVSRSDYHGHYSQQGHDLQAALQLQLSGTHHTSQEADLDDSGIGMSLMEEDLAIAKFGLSGAHAGPGMM
ncbi:hypothetical protein LTR04_000491, partial [Oleoguttula sp. CCFEE 6159]